MPSRFPRGHGESVHSPASYPVHAISEQSSYRLRLYLKRYEVDNKVETRCASWWAGEMTDEE
jgi:hypothetical protein